MGTNNKNKDFRLIPAGQAVVIEAADIETIPADILDSLKVGDFVVKHTTSKYDSVKHEMVPCNLRHLYVVTYKGEDVGDGIVLTYNAAGYGESVAYDRTDSGWAFNSIDKLEYVIKD